MARIVLTLCVAASLVAPAQPAVSQTARCVGDPPRQTEDPLSPPCVAAQPALKRCVGDPPRQTEDPMSPPCEPFFEGDNGGATASGVTGDEVRFVIALDYGAYGRETPSSSPFLEYTDLNDPPRPACPDTFPLGNPFADTCELMPIRVARALMRTLNDRFQTYSRFVHGYAVLLPPPNGASGRRAQATEIVEDLRPFAVLDLMRFYGYRQEFADALAADGVMVFSDRAVVSDAGASANGPYQWGFWPTVDESADLFASYVCSTLVGRPAAHAGPAIAGAERRFGLLYTTDGAHAQLTHQSDAVKTRLHERCGAIWVAEATTRSGWYTVNVPATGPDEADAVAKFSGSGITTVLMIGGTGGAFTRAAAAVGYHPEIVFLGDLTLDNGAYAELQDPVVWSHAWGTSFALPVLSPDDRHGVRTYVEGTGGEGLTKDHDYAEDVYRAFFMLFTAVQRAGAAITPPAVETGMRFLTGTLSFADGYSGIHDAMEIWWNGTARTDASDLPGCYRVVRSGARFRPDEWPGTDDVFIGTSDPCTANHTSVRMRF